MNMIAKPVQLFRPSADFAAIGDLIRGGMPLARRDLTESRVSAARSVLGRADFFLAPASAHLVLAWLKNLAPLVRNAPASQAAAEVYARQAVEICDDIPAGAFNEESRKAWIKQGEKGTWWPSVAELYAHLKPFGERVKREIGAARKIVDAADQAPPAPRRRPSDAEREVVSEMLSRLREEKSAQTTRDAALLKWGSWMPEGAESLSGDDLASFLERVLDDVPEEGKEITTERIAMLKRASKMARMIEGRA